MTTLWQASQQLQAGETTSVALTAQALAAIQAEQGEGARVYSGMGGAGAAAGDRCRCAPGARCSTLTARWCAGQY